MTIILLMGFDNSNKIIEVVYSILKYSDKTERNQKMTEMYKWLNQKD